MIRFIKKYSPYLVLIVIEAIGFSQNYIGSISFTGLKCIDDMIGVCLMIGGFIILLIFSIVGQCEKDRKEDERDYAEYINNLIARWAAYKARNESLKNKGLEAYKDMYIEFPIKEQELLRSLGKYACDGESWEIFKIYAKEMELKNKTDEPKTTK
jgi:hypothetical protein